MCNSDSGKLAEDVMNAYVDFEIHFNDKRKEFPAEDFKAFFEAVVRYVESVRRNQIIHRNVAATVNGLRNMLELKFSHVPDEAIYDTDRLECMLFSDYDPYFEGGEPPGL